MQLFQYIYGSEHFFHAIANLGSIIPVSPFCAHKTSVLAKKTAIGLLEHYYIEFSENKEYFSVMDDHLLAYKSNWTFATSPIGIRKNIFKMLKVCTTASTATTIVYCYYCVLLL
jgi:hypothetical protein